MIPAAVSAAAGFHGEPQAATTAKESPKTRSATQTSAFDGNNQNTFANSAVFVSTTFSADGEGGHFPSAAGSSLLTLQKSIASMVSFNSSSDEGPDASRPNEALGNKVDVVYSLLSMLSSHDRLQSSQMLLSISQDRENCQLIRRSGCMGLLIQLLHPSDVVPLPPPTGDELEVIRRASEALKNIVRFDDDEARQRRESVVLLLLEHVRNYVLHLRLVLAGAATYQSEFCEQAYAAMATLTKLSYDEEQRRSTCVLGGLHCIAEALILDQKIFSENCPPMNLDFRRFIGMTLTNLTYGASETKRTLCSSSQFLQALNAQIASQPEELRQVFAGVLRNLSWKTDASSKVALREAGTVATLMRAAMEAQKEATLKSILSALWNLSAHCSENKARICAVPSALEFLISTLAYKSLSRSMAVVESGGGILRNVSSHISLKEEYRAVLRQHSCFQILLEHLQSPSLTIVSNACGTLWNLSAHSVVDQRTLWQMGAEKKLRDLVHSKHKMISLGSSATLKNLLASRPKEKEGSPHSSTASNLERKSHGLMKLRQHKSAADKEGDENHFAFLSSHHDSPLGRSITANQASDASLAICASSPQRRQTPAVEIAAMLNDVTRPVVLKSVTPPFRIPSAPPSKINERMSTSHVMNEATVNVDLTRSQRMHSSTISASFSLPSSKEEQIQIDKAAVHRFHNSLRRSSQPQTRMDTASDDHQLSFSAVAYGNAIVQMQHQPYTAYCDPGATRFATGASMSGAVSMKGAPFMAIPHVGYGSKHGSPEKHKADGASILKPDLKPDGAQNQQRTAFRKPSGPGTPAEFKSEPSSRGSKSVTALTPLMFSRQSSMESLDSCDQHSVRSTVYSEYSQLPTGLPSPSELPDSPTNTLPPPMTAERKALIASHQQRCGFSSEERRDSEPGSVGGDSSAAAAATGYPCFSDVDPCQSKKHDLDDDKPRIFGKDAERDDDEKPEIYRNLPKPYDEEKPKVYSKMTDRPQGEFESNKLSASSSLSALTIDSDIKPKPLKLSATQNDRIEFTTDEQSILVFTSDKQPPVAAFGSEAQKVEICQELQDCILAARPSPKGSDNPFKVPRLPFPSASKPAPANRTISQPKPTQMMTVGQANAGTTAGGEDEADLRHVMQSAMPKPKAVRPKVNSNLRLLSPHRKASHNVSVVRPIVRESPATSSGLRSSTEMARLTSIPSPLSRRKNCTMETTTDADSRAKEASGDSRPENVMEKSEELLECIALALPKPKTTRKSKSLDRRFQRRDMAVAFTNSVETSQERAPVASKDCSVTSGSVMLPSNYDQDESRALLLLSCSSALMSTAATAERIKDATVLFDSSNSIGIRSPPVARVAPEPHGGNSSNASQAPPLPTSSSPDKEVEKNVDNSAPLDPITVAEPRKREAAENEPNDDSLSEDNYSQIYDESFNVAPEDLDVDSMKDDEWLLAAANEHTIEGCADMAFFNGDQIPSPTELLIDCETYSGTSKGSTTEVSPAAANVRPKILKGPPPPLAIKSVKGGRRTLQGNLASTLAAPKVTVRTTKATELRAKKAQQQTPGTKNEQGGLRAPTAGSARSRSMSPALNSSGLPLTPRRTTDPTFGKTSPSNRLRHCSSSSGRQDGHSPLAIAKDSTQKAEDQAGKSPKAARPQQPFANAKSKRELGSNVKRKIESLQKRESASEDDTTSPLMRRKANNVGSISDRKGSPKSPQAAVKNQLGGKDSGNRSNKGVDGKRALVTTV